MQRSKKETEINYDIHKRIMKFSIIDIDDLIRFWYTDTTFQEILSDFEWSGSIWLEVINNTFYYYDFPFLGEALKYFYENKIISFKVLKRFLNPYKGTHAYKTYCVPKFLLKNIKFLPRTISNLFYIFLYNYNYMMSGFIIELGNLDKSLMCVSGSGIKTIIEHGQLDFLDLVLNKCKITHISDFGLFKKLAYGYYSEEGDLIGALEIFIKNNFFPEITDFEYLLELRRPTFFRQIIDVAHPFVNLKQKVKNIKFTQTEMIYYSPENMTLLDHICLKGCLQELIVLVDYNFDISDPSFSTINLIGAVKASSVNYKDKKEMVDILKNARAIFPKRKIPSYQNSSEEELRKPLNMYTLLYEP